MHNPLNSYWYKYCGEEVKKAKGVPMNVSEKLMTAKDYKTVMVGKSLQSRKVYGIR